jgi:hypothetical protein
VPRVYLYCEDESSVDTPLRTGNGPNFTVGGDLSLFAGTAREQLPNRLRHIIDGYHLAIQRLWRAGPDDGWRQHLVSSTLECDGARAISAQPLPDRARSI